MESVWEKYLEKKTKEAKKEISQELEKDIVVVGGGIAGFLVAYYLSESGENVCLIEAEKLFGGVTKNTTAHINALQGKYKDIPTKKQKRLYFGAQIEAIDEIEKLVNKYKIECDFKRVDSFLFGNSKDLKKEYKALLKLGADIQHLEEYKLPFDGISNVVKLEGQAKFNPIKFLNGLPKKFEIIENARVLKVNLARKILKTDKQTFRANKIIFASNFPIVSIRGLYAFKMYKSLSYATHIKTDRRLDGIYNSIEDDGLTFRDCEDGVIVGGLDHRTGRSKGCAKFDELTLYAGVFDGRWETKWAANDCITFDSIPYAGRFNLAKDVYMISGFGKWGMTNAVACAKTINNIITNKQDEYVKLFNPRRILNIKVWMKVLFNALFNVGNILLSIFSGPRCPHMLCRLRFNKNTKTWDCPCHGSRFTASGVIIAEPTIKDISV